MTYRIYPGQWWLSLHLLWLTLECGIDRCTPFVGVRVTDLRGYSWTHWNSRFDQYGMRRKP